MRLEDQLNRLIKLNHYIRNEKTGSPEEFAKKLGISKRQLSTMLKFMRNFNLSIGYSKILRTYYFKNTDGLDIILKLGRKNKKQCFKGENIPSLH